MRTIQWKGNTASHTQDGAVIHADDALPALAALANVTGWYFEQYGSQYRDRRPSVAEKPEMVNKGRKIVKNPTFGKIAVGAMVGTGVALAAKFLFGNAEKKENRVE